MTDRENIKRAFRKLRKQGYIARMNFMCCSSCAWYEIGGYALAGIRKEELPEPEKVVFFNKQSNDSFDNKGNLKYSLCLQWAGDPSEIMVALKGEGLLVEHNGDESQTIFVNSKEPERETK